MIQILTWIDANTRFGIPLTDCREVSKDLKITHVPHSKDFIAGIVNMRGDTVTVIDLAKLLNYHKSNTQLYSSVIRIKSTGSPIGLIAEKIDDILELEEESIQDASRQLGEEEAKYIQKVALTPMGLVLIVNTETILQIHV